jgi:hypothetical protein
MIARALSLLSRAFGACKSTAKLAALLALGAGGFAVYDGYDAVRDRLHERRETVRDAGEQFLDRAEVQWDKLSAWAEGHPEQTAGYVVTLLVFAYLFRSHRKMGRSLKESAFLTAGRVYAGNGQPAPVPLVPEGSDPVAKAQRALIYQQLLTEQAAKEKRHEQIEAALPKAEQAATSAARELAAAEATAAVKRVAAKQAIDALEQLRREQDSNLADFDRVSTKLKEIEPTL